MVGRTFEITGVITHRNSFNPHIVGRIAPTSSGSRVEGTMSLPALVRGFMTVWLSLVLFIGCNVVLSHEPGSSPWAGFIPVGMFAFGIGLSHFGFRLDGGASLQALEAVLRSSGDAAPGITSGDQQPRPVSST